MFALKELLQQWIEENIWTFIQNLTTHLVYKTWHTTLDPFNVYTMYVWEIGNGFHCMRGSSRVKAGQGYGVNGEGIQQAS